MKRLTLITFFSLITVITLLPLTQQAHAYGFQWPDIWYIDTHAQLRQLDPTTGAWHPFAPDILAVEGSYYNNGQYEDSYYVTTSNVKTVSCRYCSQCRYGGYSCSRYYWQDGRIPL